MGLLFSVFGMLCFSAFYLLLDHSQKRWKTDPMGLNLMILSAGTLLGVLAEGGIRPAQGRRGDRRVRPRIQDFLGQRRYSRTCSMSRLAASTSGACWTLYSTPPANCCVPNASTNSAKSALTMMGIVPIRAFRAFSWEKAKG